MIEYTGRNLLSKNKNKGIDGKNGIDGSSGTIGSNGREIELQKTSAYLQWRYVGDVNWNNLIAIADLNGLSIIWKGSLSSSPSSPQLNWAYYNTTDKKSYVYNGNTWSILAQDGIDSFAESVSINANSSAYTYNLQRSKENVIRGNLPSGVSSTLILETHISGKVNQTTLHFTTGGTAPTIVYPSGTLSWLYGLAPEIVINKKYEMVFTEIEETSGVWIIKGRWGYE